VRGRWFLTNEQMAEARKKINDEAGSRRVFAHMIFTPGQPGWLDKLDAGLALKPESCKGYTIGDNTHKDISRYPWRMDDEKVAYKGYEKMVAAGIKNVCIHKGLFAPGVEKEFPRLRGFADVADVGQAAKDWPQLNFVIYHSAYRHVGGDPKQALAEFERTGRISWTSDLADIPTQYGVTNVYGDVGQLFATTLVAEPNVCAAPVPGTQAKKSARPPTHSAPTLRIPNYDVHSEYPDITQCFVVWDSCRHARESFRPVGARVRARGSQSGCGRPWLGGEAAASGETRER
jgi:hypothetical protein